MRISGILSSGKMCVQSFWRIMAAIDPPRETARSDNKPICKQEEGSEEQLRSRKKGEYDDLVVLSENSREVENRRRLGGLRETECDRSCQ